MTTGDAHTSTESEDSRSSMPGPIKGRGAGSNPANRFDQTACELDPEFAVGSRPETVYIEDASKSILVRNDSPDVGFEVGLNPYRGCEHGCIYCYARPSHEYLGYSAGLDFETRIVVKKDAPVLLRKELASPKWKPQTIALSGNTDCYQPAERRLQITRGCLEVFAEFRNPVSIITKNALVTRDLDLLSALAADHAACVFITVTTLDVELNRKLEPRTSLPRQRLDALRQLHEAGVPVGVMLAPIIPGLNDHEIPAMLEAAAACGARYAGHIALRLPYGVAPLFEQWLEQHYPARKDKILNRIRSMRGGKLNDPRFGSRMRGEGVYARQIDALFEAASRKHGFQDRRPPLSTAAFRRPGGQQLSLFDDGACADSRPIVERKLYG